MASESYKLDLTVSQIRSLRYIVEHYIRNHDVILHNNEFDLDAMRLLFADMVRYCELCKMLNNILREHDNQQYKEGK